jgi:murein DD-endopeptidase MepM/ murein hydrolase activator NlpD
VRWVFVVVCLCLATTAAPAGVGVASAAVPLGAKDGAIEYFRHGNYRLVHGEGEHRTYMYAHMKKPPRVHKGERAWAGERVGEVGKTGNARTVGCQLHFEIHVDGRPIDPKPTLERWDRTS